MKKIAVVLMMIGIMVIGGLRAECVQASELSEYDFTDVQDVIDKNGEDMDFGSLVSSLYEGSTDGGASVIEKVFALFIQEIKANLRIMVQLFMLAVVSAVFSNFTYTFKSSTVSAMGFNVTYMAMLLLLISAFVISSGIAADTVSLILEFMQSLLVVFFTSVSFSCGSLSGIGFYQVVLVVITLCEVIFLKVVIPLTKIYFILQMVNNFSENAKFTKMAEFIAKAIKWMGKIMLVIVVGLNTVKSMTLPFADSLKKTAFLKTVGIIPGVGQTVNTASSVVYGAACLIKNSIGTAGVIAICVIALVPVMKLITLMFMYKCASALIEVVADKRMVNAVHSLSESNEIFLNMVVTVMMLFIITIGIVCVSTNINYYSVEGLWGNL